MSVITSPVIMQMVCYVLVQIMALVYVASASASQTGREMHVIVVLLPSPVFRQVVEKSAQAMETANVGHVNVTRGRKDVTQENSVRSFQ